jgi:outer membrane lipoprotein-sorting protein
MTPVQKTASPQKLPEVLKEMHALFSKKKTLHAKFVQTKHLIALKQVKLSDGEFWIKQGQAQTFQWRWLVKSPFEMITLSDGKNLWQGTKSFDFEAEGPSGAQAQTQKDYEWHSLQGPEAQMRSTLLYEILAGNFSHCKVTTVKQSGVTQAQDLQFELTPADKNTPISKAIIDLSPGGASQPSSTNKKNERTVQRVELFQTDGNRTELKLSNIELGVSMPDDLFCAPKQTAIPSACSPTKAKSK